LRIVYENIFSNAPKTLYFARDFLMAGIAGILQEFPLKSYVSLKNTGML